MDIPAELKYTKDHEWVRVDDNVAVIGITDYAQGELGDIVFVELPSVGTETTQMQPFGTIEAVKAVSDLMAPLSGKVAAINETLDNDPTLVNQSPYDEGWMIKIEFTDASELDSLLSADDYRKTLEG